MCYKKFTLFFFFLFLFISVFGAQSTSFNTDPIIASSQSSSSSSFQMKPSCVGVGGTSTSTSFKMFFGCASLFLEPPSAPVPEPIPGFQCTSDTQCDFDKKCVNNLCVSVNCSADFVAFNHTCVECVANSNCESGFECVSNACVKKKECLIDADCSAGFECVNNSCVKKEEEKEKEEEKKEEGGPGGGEDGGEGSGGDGGASGALSCVNHLTSGEKVCDLNVSFSSKVLWVNFVLTVSAPNDVNIVIQNLCYGFPVNEVFSCNMTSVGEKDVLFFNKKGKLIYSDKIKVRELVVVLPQRSVIGEKIEILAKDNFGEIVPVLIDIKKGEETLLSKKTDGSLLFDILTAGLYSVKVSVENGPSVEKKLFGGAFAGIFGGEVIEAVGIFFLGENFFNAPLLGSIELLLCVVNAVILFLLSNSFFKNMFISSREERERYLIRMFAALGAFFVPIIFFRLSISLGLAAAVLETMSFFISKRIIEKRTKGWTRV